MGSSTKVFVILSMSFFFAFSCYLSSGHAYDLPWWIAHRYPLNLMIQPSCFYFVNYPGSWCADYGCFL